MSQPEWKFIANLGDQGDPIEHGGYFVYSDATGVYPPEGVYLTSDDSENDRRRVWTEYRFSLDQLGSSAEWFEDSLTEVASYIGSTADELLADLRSDDVLHRAHAYRAIGEYHGFENLDSYPNTYKGTKGRQELEARYWFEAGEKHPPAGTRRIWVQDVQDHFTASYPERLPDFPSIQRSAAAVVISLGTIRGTDYLYPERYLITLGEM